MPKPPNLERLHSVSTTAERLSVSTAFVRGEVRAGRIRCHKLGDRTLISEAEIQRIIRQSEVQEVASD